MRSGPNNPVYEVTLHELATIPSWGAPSVAPEHMKLSGQTQKVGLFGAVLRLLVIIETSFNTETQKVGLCLDSFVLGGYPQL